MQLCKFFVICYFNLEWIVVDGGVLKFYLFNEDGIEEMVIVLLEVGWLMLFESYVIEYEVEVVYCEWCSIMGWFKDEI